MQIREVFLETLRRHHVLLSIFMAHPDAQLTLSLPQRVVVLACLVSTSLCVSALLLGRDSFDSHGRILASVIAAACMVGSK